MQVVLGVDFFSRRKSRMFAAKWGRSVSKVGGIKILVTSLLLG